MQISRWQKLTVSFYAFIAILLISISLFSFQSFHSLVEKESWIKQSHKVIDSGKDLLLALEEAETNQRGYIISADSLYLTSYQTSLRAIQLNQNSLAHLTRDNPSQQERIEKLQDLIQEKAHFMNKSEMWRNKEKTAELHQHFTQAKEKEKTDAIKSQLTSIINEEYDLLLKRNKELEQVQQLTLSVIYALALMAFLVIIFLFTLFRQHMKVKETYEQSLYRKNMELETSNEELLASSEEISAGHEQLITVNEELKHSHNLLTQLYEQLEQIVEERTAELRESNEKLACRILEHEKTEIELKSTKDLYQDLYDNAPEMYLSFNVKTTQLVNCNQAVLKMLGYSKEELIGHSVLDLNHPDYLELANRAVHHLLEKGVVENAPLKIKTKDGKILDVLQNSTAVRNDNGEIIATRCCWQDYTELKKVQDELEKSEELFRMMTENANDLISKIDINGMYTYVSPASLQLIGYTPEELLGCVAFDFIHEEDIDGIRRLHIQLNQIPDKYRFTCRVRKKSGKYVWIETTTKALRDEAGQLQELLCISRDISERILAEEEQKQNAEKLQLANKEMESFSYSVSHDLRAPLRAIIGFSKILQNDFANQLGEEGKDLTGFIIKNTTKMGLLIDDLLAFSRLGRQEKLEAEFKMDKLVKDVVNELKLNNLERKIQFTVDPLPNAYGDHSLIRHVLINILSNAIKFSSTRELAEITISSFTQNGEAVFKFQDNGVGFNMKYVGKIFDVFQRLHSEAEFPGTGIGMALAQKIIHRHGGRIWAEGEVGKGATFFFTLGKNK